MPVGLVGRKSGMTRVFTEEGNSIPVTVVEVQPNRVTQVKTPETDGYSAVQVTMGSRKPSRLNRAEIGHFAKAGTGPGAGLWEFRLDDDSSGTGKAAGKAAAAAKDAAKNAAKQELEALHPGAELKVDRFTVGQKVDVTGTSKGKGFQGVVKRHNFRMQDASHGNSLSHRAPGSIGQCQTPGRVWKGKKMAGQMGNVRKTAQSLEIIRIDSDNNLLLIKGALPGATGSDVIVRPAAKHPDLSNRYTPPPAEAKQEPSAGKEPSAKQEPSAGKEPSADQNPDNGKGKE